MEGVYSLSRKQPLLVAYEKINKINQTWID